MEGARAPFIAGEEKTIDILTVDAYGHATAQDGSAGITVNIASGTHTFPGESGRERFAANHEAYDVLRYSMHNMRHNVLLQSWSVFHICHQPTGILFTVYKSIASTLKSRHASSCWHLAFAIAAQTARIQRKQLLPQPM